MPDMPENLNYEEKEEYDQLTGQGSPFKGKDNTADLWILALAIGYKQGFKKKLSKKQPNIRLKTRSIDFFWKVRPLSISKKKSLDPLLDESTLFSEAEEYSNAGIKMLMKTVFGPGKKRFDVITELLQEIDKLASEK